MKAKIRTYTDGIIRFYRVSSQNNSFGAHINVSNIDDLELLEKLPYNEKSKRIQDLEFAEQNGFSLTIKVSTPFRPEIDNKCKAVINNYLYDVKYVDTDRGKKEIYAYLEGVKKIHEGGT